MPRGFLLATWEGGGTVPPVLTVARRLLARGHRVRVMLDACARADVEAAGAEFVAWSRAPSRPDRSPASDPARDWEAGSPPEKFARLRDAVMTGPALGYAEDTLAELARRPADLVVSSEMLLGVMAAAEAAKRPLAVLSTNVSLFPLPGVPPMGAGLLPRAERGRTATARRLRPPGAGPTQRWAAGAERGTGLARPRPLADVEDQLSAAARILLGTSRAFDFAPERLPERVRYVGPHSTSRPGRRLDLAVRREDPRPPARASAPPSRTRAASCSA